MVTATHCFDVPVSQCKGVEVLPVYPRWQLYAVNCNSVEKMERAFFNNNESYQKNPGPVARVSQLLSSKLGKSSKNSFYNPQRLRRQWKSLLKSQPLARAVHRGRLHLTGQVSHSSSWKAQAKFTSSFSNTQDHLSHICLRVFYERLTLNMHLN